MKAYLDVSAKWIAGVWGLEATGAVHVVPGGARFEVRLSDGHASNLGLERDGEVLEGLTVGALVPTGLRKAPVK